MSAAAAGCGRTPAGEPHAGAYKGAPIVLISIDTLRSDHLPAYGYRRVETPAIDALRRDAVLFTRAYSHVPLTLPSHCSILTGRLPGDHGVRDNVGYHFDAAAWSSLPLVLKHAGYATGGAVSAFVLRGETGISRGFDYWDSQVAMQLSAGLAQSRRPGQETARLALGWLRGVAGRPFFLFLHLYEPHSPYTPPEPFASRYKDSPYDGEIANADAVVGGVLAELERLGVYEHAIVVLLSDHGEGLGEHGEAEHGMLLYRTTLQVPLLLKLPGSRLGGTSVAAPAQLVDVYPTLLSAVGVAPPPGLPGRSLLELGGGAAGERELYAETNYPRLHFGWSELSSLIRGRFHYIHGPDPELYDLDADPAEVHQARERERRSFADLRGRVTRYQRQLRAPAAVDAETARQLAALGYAAGAVQGPAGGPAIDPKSHLASLADLNLAMRLFFRHQYAESVPVFRRALAANPKTVDAWEHLGEALAQLGRLDEALAAHEEAMKASGGVANVALATGALLLRLGRFDEAQGHAELAKQVSPGEAQSLLAEIALARHQPAVAERAARAALAAGGEAMAPRLALAEVLVAEGRLEEALGQTDQVLAELARRAPGQSYPKLWWVRGDILARLQRDAEAEQAFQREIQSFPADTHTYASLAVLYAAEGKPDAAIGVLRQMVESQGESPAACAEAVSTLRVLGDAPGAAALLRHALELHPGSSQLRALERTG